MGSRRARLVTRSVLMVVLVAMLVLCMFAATALAGGDSAKNVIIMITDGCGYNCVLATDYYQYGAAGTQAYERFPVQLGVSTYPAGGHYNPYLAWTDFNEVGGWAANRVTESNMAATAMGTGYKCAGGVGIDEHANRVPTIVEIAEQLGKATGVVSTQSFAEATPAGFSAHALDRKALKSIIEQQLRESKLDVAMGAHNPWYNNNGEKLETPYFSDTSKYLWKESTWNDVVAGKIGNDADGDGEVEYWDVIESRADFQAMATGPTPERVLGVVQCGGEDKVGSGYTQFYRTGAANDAPFTVPFLETSPTLSEMSLAALNVLDNDPDGFFVMIEGANPDYGNHFGWLGRAIEEQIDFNDAVEAVIAWVEANSSWDETLLVITSDHETGGIWGPGAGVGTPAAPSASRFIVKPDQSVFVPLVNNGAGQVPGHLYTNHRWEYGPDFYWHTNQLVPLYAKGAGASVLTTQVRGVDPVRGPYIDNTDIFQVTRHVFTDGAVPAQVGNN